MTAPTRRIAVTIAAMVMAANIATPARAQVARQAGMAVVEGVVRERGGSPLEGAAVTIVPGATVTTTDDGGRFRVGVVAGAALEVRVERSGHATEILRLPALRTGERRELAVTLAALYALDALTVTAPRERPLLNTVDAVVGGTIERAEAVALPTDARDPLTLAYTIPGVAPASGFFGDAPPLSIAGGNSLYTAYSVDGLDNTEGFLGGPRVEMPLAALERLSVMTSGYGVLAGRSPTGVVDAESRAGSAGWAGQGFVYYRPGIPLDASPKFAPAGVDPEGFRRTQVGGSVGGPLVRDRSFLFLAAEYSDEREDRIGSTARTQFLGTELRETWKGFARLDHGWSAHQTTTVRLAASDVSRAGQGGGVIVPEADVTTRRVGTLASLTHRSVLGAGTTANELSAQVGTYRWYFPPTRSDLTTPRVTIVAPDSLTVEAVVGSSNFLFDESEVQLQLRNVLETRTRAGHTLRVGGDLTASFFELDAAATSPAGSYTVINDGNIVASGRFVSISDIPADVRVLRYSVDARPQQVDLTQTVVGAFAEDVWRVSPSLTLNLGLRWDYDDITARGESAPDLDNLQPRASFNWYAGPRTVVRGGAGRYVGKLPYAVYSDAVQFGPEGNAVVTLEGAELPPPRLGEGPTSAELRDRADAFPPREVRRMFARGLDQPESLQGSLGWQREIGASWGLSVDAVWVESFHLPRSWDLNAIDRPLTPADTVDRPESFGDPSRPVTPAAGAYRRLTTTDTGGRARYLGLHTEVRRRVTESLTFDASWVWSRARTDTEDINFNAVQGNDFDAEWADAVNDRRHRVALRAVHTRGRVRVGGIAEYQTGTPLNRIANFRDLDGSGPIYGEGFVGNYDRYPGVPRNGERLPSSFLVHGTAAYGVPIGRGKTEVRIDVFNVLNSLVVSGFANGIPGGGPRTQVGRPGDPVVYGAGAPPRQVQLSVTWRG